MKIGLICVDGHNFPNIPLMKLSAYHKAQGDSVQWYEPMDAFGEEYDVVYMSKVFGFTPDYQYPVKTKKLVRGGVGTVSNWWTEKRFTTPRTTARSRTR